MTITAPGSMWSSGSENLRQSAGMKIGATKSLVSVSAWNSVLQAIGDRNFAVAEGWIPIGMLAPLRKRDRIIVRASCSTRVRATKPIRLLYGSGVSIDRSTLVVRKDPWDALRWWEQKRHRARFLRWAESAQD